MSVRTDKNRIYLIGNPTRDRIVRGGKTIHTFGGTVLYAGLYLARSGIPVDIVGKGDKAIQTWIESRGIGSKHFIVSNRVVAFENRYGSDGRQQQARPGSDILVDEVPKAVFQARGILVGAVLMEVDPRVIGSPRSGVLMVDVQGFIRKLGTDGQVSLCVNPALEEAISGCDILKADAPEAEAITGINNVCRAARQLYRMGPRVVIITLSALGSGIFDGQRWIRIRAPKLPAVDPTGAGDVFDAAFLAEYLRNGDIVEAGQFGTTAASLSVTGIGTAAVPSVEQVRKAVADQNQSGRMVVVERLTG